MNMKKIVAGVAASALAVSAMAISASAAGVLETDIKYFTDDGSGNYQMYLVGADIGGNPYNIDVSKIDSFDITLSWDGEWAGGAVVIQYESDGWWTQLGVFAADEEDGRDWSNLSSGDTFNAKLPKSIPADEPTVILTFQNWAADVTVKIDDVVIKDASGAVLADLNPASDPEPTPDPAATDPDPAATDPEPTTPDPDKPATNTGIEGVAVVAGLAVLATGAVVISKKRK